MRPSRPFSSAPTYGLTRKPEKIGRNSHDVLVGIFGNVVRSLVRSSKPVIAAVNVRLYVQSRALSASRFGVRFTELLPERLQGVAAGAGASLALAADFRVMATDAAILQAFVNVALVQDGASGSDDSQLTHAAGSSFFLTRLVGYSRALEITLEGAPNDSAGCELL